MNKIRIKKIIQIILGAMMALSTALSFSSKAHAATEQAFDWDALYATCGSDWNQYTRRLEDVRVAFAEEATNLTKKQFVDRFLKDDPKILLIKATWPKMLAGKDEFWRAASNCATEHQQVLEDLSSTESTLELKRDSVASFSDCVQTHYSRDLRVSPLGQLVRCYSQQVK